MIWLFSSSFPSMSLRKTAKTQRESIQLPQFDTIVKMRAWNILMKIRIFELVGHCSSKYWWQRNQYASRWLSEVVVTWSANINNVSPAVFIQHHFEICPLFFRRMSQKKNTCPELKMNVVTAEIKSWLAKGDLWELWSIQNFSYAKAICLILLSTIFPSCVTKNHFLFRNSRFMPHGFWTYQIPW